MAMVTGKGLIKRRRESLNPGKKNYYPTSKTPNQVKGGKYPKEVKDE